MRPVIAEHDHAARVLARLEAAKACAASSIE